MENYSIILIKILKERYLNDFLNGDIYLNSLNYFTSIDESDCVRFDQDEGVDESLQVKSISIEDINGKWVPIGGVINPVTYRYDKKDKFNILCMHAYSNRNDEYFDTRNLEFGECAVVITDLHEFIQRAKNAASAVNKSVLHGRVRYVNRKTYHGVMGPFRKYNEYEYQKEFRFLIGDGDDSPYVLNIGDIRDITLVIPSQDIPLIPRK